MRSAIWLVVPVVALLVSGAARAAEEPPSFAKDVKPFLEKYCVECHKGNKPKAGINLSSYEGVTKNEKKKVVVASKPQLSLLVLTMESKGEKKMPPKKYEKQPTAKEIAIIRAWVAAGAKDDSADSQSVMPKELRRDTHAAEILWAMLNERKRSLLSH